jgi:hypothetical protein
MMRLRERRKRRVLAGTTEVAGAPTRSDRQHSDKAGRWWRRLLVNMFLLWHLFALGIWLLPNSALRRSFVEIVFPYLSFTGLVQNWSMFAPNPSDVDVYVEARVKSANGQVRSWTFPRMIGMGYLERYRRERFRKLIELGHLDAASAVWPSLARYAARVNNTEPHNPPVSVELVRHFRFIPPPGVLFGPYRTYTFFTAPVGPGELR